MAVPSSILSNARILRVQLTDAEQLVWQILRDRRFCGIKFRRQHPFERFVLDFYCHEAKLVLELDGGGHNDHGQKAYDEERTKFLEDAGIRVLRFWNHDVLNNLEAVLEQLHDELFTPSPGLRPPSPRGRGEP